MEGKADVHSNKMQRKLNDEKKRRRGGGGGGEGGKGHDIKIELDERLRATTRERRTTSREG